MSWEKGLRVPPGYDLHDEPIIGWNIQNLSYNRIELVLFHFLGSVVIIVDRDETQLIACKDNKYSNK